MLFPFRARTLVASLDRDAGGGPTHPLVNQTLWLQKLIKEKVKYLCDICIKNTVFALMLKLLGTSELRNRDPTFYEIGTQ